MTRDRAVGIGLAVLAIEQLALAAYMAFAPASFFARIGPFGVLNEHYVRDVATFTAAQGLTTSDRIPVASSWGCEGGRSELGMEAGLVEAAARNAPRRTPYALWTAAPLRRTTPSTALEPCRRTCRSLTCSADAEGCARRAVLALC